MPKVLVKNNRLHFNGINYFRAASEDVALGSYGEKRTPAFQANFLEVEGQIDPKRLDAIEATTSDIDFSRTREGDLTETLTGSFKGVDFDGSANQVWDRLREGTLRLVKLHIPFNDLEDAANADRDAFEDLRDMGPRVRLVPAVWVAMSAELADTFSRAQSFDATAEKGKLKVTAKGTTSQAGETTVVLSEGTTFAYLLASIDWDKKRKKRRRKIVDLDTDQWSIH